MKRICYIIAMRAEAQPFIDAFGVEEQRDFFAPLPCLLYRGEAFGSEICIVVNGEQHGRDLIGCEAAAVTTMAAIERLHPDIVVNSGTCGGWRRHGTKVNEVYLGNGVMFHDRRVPGDNEYGTQSLGNYSVYERTAELAERLGIGMAKVTTGSSFDLVPEEEAVIEEYGGRLKEMEAAGVAFVCDLFKVPMLLVKAVCNLRDAEDDDMETFQKNLRDVSESLSNVNLRLIEELSKM